MAVPLEKFVKQLEDSGIVDGDTLKDFLPPKGDPKTAEELALELVRKKTLTKFQAEEVSKGKGKSLVLGNYVLLEKIGAGGMGQVFKARHVRMDRLVAVKLLPAAMTRDTAAIARFEREVKAAAKLRHPNIIAADDADQANGVHFLVMELVEGSDLSALVKKHGPFPVDQAVNYVLQAAKGLEFAHKKGVVHRDIKPANLLLDSERTVKILDMGLARIHGEAGTQAELTATGAVMGTVDYMAPEQALSTKTADARADIYSLGCSLYYLLTAKATYDGDTLVAKLLAHRDQPIPELRTVRPEVPNQLEAIFKKLVAKKIEDRFQTMTQVISALEGYGSGLSNMPTFESADTAQTFVLGDKSASSNTATVSPRARESAANSKSPASDLSDPSTDANHADFFDDRQSSATKSLRTKQRSSKKGKNSFLKDQKKLLLIGAAVLGVLILLGGVMVTLKTRDGKLIVTVNESDADIQVLNEEGRVEITRKGDNGPITISVVPGKHRLKVQKDGFEFFTQEFSIEAGGQQPITAKLVPLDDKTKSPVAVTKTPESQPDTLQFVDINGEEWNRLGEYWKITPQEITGSTGKARLGFSTFLCSNKTYRDFEMSGQVLLKKNNTGIQIRSTFIDRDKWILKGPQVDVGPKYWGCLYGEQTTGMMQAAPANFEQKFVKPNEFNDVSVRCVGKHVTIKINGHTSVDREFPEIADEGIIGLQLHNGETEVVFRNLRIAEFNGRKL